MCLQVALAFNFGQAGTFGGVDRSQCLQCRQGLRPPAVTGATLECKHRDSWQWRHYRTPDPARVATRTLPANSDPAANRRIQISKHRLPLRLEAMARSSLLVGGDMEISDEFALMR
jgi:hypothetical protein